VESTSDSFVRIGYNWSAALTVGSCLLLLLMFRQTTIEMVRAWYDSRTYSHCFLILPLFVFLVWMRREHLARIGTEPNLWALPVITILGFLWLLGNLGEARVMEEFALVGILVAAVWALLGRAKARVLAFPLAFLFFAVPFGQSLIGPLRDFTASFAVHALTLSNVPAVLEGRTISLPTATWNVAEACSGIRYLFSSLVVGTIYASLAYRSRTRQALFLVASFVIPILANGVRAYGIIALAHITNNRVAIDVDHIIYGGLFFLLVQGVLLLVGLRWQDKPDSGMGVPQQRILRREAQAKTRETAGRMLVLSITILAFSGILQLCADRLWQRADLASEALDLNVSVRSPWQPAATRDTSWMPHLQGADKELRQAYRSGPFQVDLYSVMYSGRSGMELIGGYNRFANPKKWVLTREGLAHAAADGWDFTVQRSLIESSTSSRSVWNWYWVGGEYTDSPTRVKLLQAKARLFGQSAVAVIIMLGIENQEGAVADEVLQDFLTHASFCTVCQGGTRRVAQPTSSPSTQHSRTIS
jgi:exosortase A